MNDSKNYSNKSFILINLILIEVFIAILSSSYVAMEINQLWGVSKVLLSRLTVAIAAIVGTISLFLIREISRLAETEQESKLNQVLLNESQETIDLLRTHRHDFLNHLQVIMGLLQLNKTQFSIEYIREVIGELKTVSRKSEIQNPVLASLFLKKGNLAEQKGVELVSKINSELNGINLSFIDLSRIVGNLIDNAIYAAAKNESGNKCVEILLAEDSNSYTISVQNTGAFISEEIRHKIFDKGFTTKGSDGNGLGLYIVKSLVDRNGGHVELNDSKAGLINFIVKFPKRID